MAVTPVEVKKTPAPRAAVDPWQNFRSEIDRLFDRFTGGGFPSMRRLLEPGPAFESGFDFNVPAVDVTEDDKVYKIAAELPGLDEKDIEVSVTGDVLTLKRKTRTGTSPSAPMARSSVRSRFPTASIATRSRRASPRES